MMAAATRIDDLDHHFDDHPSVVDSLEDYEEAERRSPLWDLPSQHSGFKSEHENSEIDDQSSTGAPWSPPGFQNRSTNASGWFRQDPYGRYNLRPSNSPSRSRQTSPEYQDAQEGDADVTIAANIPLPAGFDSPIKERSPEPEVKQEEDEDFGTPEPASAENINNCSSLFHPRVAQPLIR
jgi:hypothetical protein